MLNRRHLILRYYLPQHMTVIVLKAVKKYHEILSQSILVDVQTQIHWDVWQEM